MLEERLSEEKKVENHEMHKFSPPQKPDKIFYHHFFYRKVKGA